MSSRAHKQHGCDARDRHELAPAIRRRQEAGTKLRDEIKELRRELEAAAAEPAA